MANTRPRTANTRWVLVVFGLVLGLLLVGQSAYGQQPGVVGGEPATTEQYPWVVALELDGMQWCGGTLVAPTKVVTAAHCVTDKALSRWRILAGRTDLRTQAGIVAKPAALWIHPGFQQLPGEHDLAVITLDRSLPYRTLALARPTDAELYKVHTKATVLGWGDTTGRGNFSDTLRQAALPIMAEQTCQAAYSAYLPTTMLCAGFPLGGKDSCKADSGGPLVVENRLIGVVSWGEGCAEPHKPGVYVRISAYYQQLMAHI